MTDTTNTTGPITPRAGMGATKPYVTDTTPYVVTRVAPSGRTLWARRVELDETTGRNENPNLAAGELPVRLTDGDLSKPYGAEERYTLRANGRWQRGGERLILGHAVRRVDYRA